MRSRGPGVPRQRDESVHVDVAVDVMMSESETHCARARAMWSTVDQSAVV